MDLWVCLTPSELGMLRSILASFIDDNETLTVEKPEELKFALALLKRLWFYREE